MTRASKLSQATSEQQTNLNEISKPDDTNDSDSNSESSIESTHDQDEDFELNSNEDSDEDLMMEVINVVDKKQKPFKKPNKRKKQYQQKDLAYIQNRYKGINMDYISDIDSDESLGPKEEASTTKAIKHQWYFDLCDSFDKLPLNFSSNYLVIFRGHTNILSKYSLHDLQSATKDIFQKHIQKVNFIQRGFYTQFYILKELQNSLHFSLSSNASQHLMNICKNKNIVYKTYSNEKCYSDESMLTYSKMLMN